MEMSKIDDNFDELINKFKYDFFYNDNKNNFSIIRKLTK